MTLLFWSIEFSRRINGRGNLSNRGSQALLRKMVHLEIILTTEFGLLSKGRI